MGLEAGCQGELESGAASALHAVPAAVPLLLSAAPFPGRVGPVRALLSWEPLRGYLAPVRPPWVAPVLTQARPQP